jgi:hypothetical protein
MELGQSEVGAIYLGSTQIIPTGTANTYTHTLTNIKVVYSSGTYLKPDGSNYAYFTGTYTLMKGGTSISSKSVTLYPTFVSRMIVRGTSNDRYLYWNKAGYGQTAVSQNQITINLNYGALTAVSSVAIGENSYKIVSSEIYPYINGTTTPTFSNKSTTAGIQVDCRLTRRWTSGLGEKTEEINKVSLFNWTANVNWVTFSSSGGYVIVSDNNTGTKRQATYTLTLIEDTSITKSGTIKQNA